MKLLIISGTPKTDGITYSFVKTAEETAKTLGIEAETITLSSMNLNKCKMCDDGWGMCFYEHYCIFGEKDGFTKLQQKVKEADAYIYLTPVYWGEMSEELKLFMDKLRRCEATKQWDSRVEEVSFHKGKPSIFVAVAGGGGGGCGATFVHLERAIGPMGGDEWPKEHAGIFDCISVNRWNQRYKREALKAAITTMYDFFKRPRAVSVEALPDYKLLITYDNGEKQTFDVTPYLEMKSHNVLKDITLFNKAKVSGTKIEWRPLLDIDIVDIYPHSKLV
ncbi:MAG: NAD(P)H-dependent oxidoreductase [Oscillospiraceae bacterium]|jgi:multimeric flavodoxin WrbA|nr:NAD(P)H-dependent oxidoreductase [Oscillospiraceae bacterium]